MTEGTHDSLDVYRRKRNFDTTPEPSGETVSGSDPPLFIVQEHDASTLHYDLRLEVDGVLKSWAVPKGPSTDPSEKRLAMPTEDHPLDYADFEGVIPEDEYGAGAVIVWDRGPYRNLRGEKDEAMSMADSLSDGKAEVWLDGQKIRGGYALIRTADGEDERWLLIKMDDEEADARRKPTSTEPRSVFSDRTLDEVADEEGDEEQADG